MWSQQWSCRFYSCMKKGKNNCEKQKLKKAIENINRRSVRNRVFHVPADPSSCIAAVLRKPLTLKSISITSQSFAFISPRIATAPVLFGKIFFASPQTWVSGGCRMFVKVESTPPYFVVFPVPTTIEIFHANNNTNTQSIVSPQFFNQQYFIFLEFLSVLFKTSILLHIEIVLSHLYVKPSTH